MAQYIVRFSDFVYYDINYDEEWVRLMATTDKGSYYTEVPRVSPSKYRQNRQRFKEQVIAAMQDGLDPCYIDLTVEELTHG